MSFIPEEIRQQNSIDKKTWAEYWADQRFKKAVDNHRELMRIREQWNGVDVRVKKVFRNIVTECLGGKR